MHIHCKNWANVILEDVGKGPGGQREEQVSHGLGLRTTMEETFVLTLERWGKMWAV